MGVQTWDDFQRPDSAVTVGRTPEGDLWNPIQGTFGISSQHFYRVSAVDGDYILVDALASDVDLRATVTAVAPGGGSNVFGLGLIVASSADGANHYMGQFETQGGNYHIFKKVAGSYSSLVNTSTGFVFSAGDELGVSVSGSTISVLHNGSVVVSTTDSSVTKGTCVGFRFGGTDNTWRVSKLTGFVPGSMRAVMLG